MFILFCTIIMWVMIVAVSLLYVAICSRQETKSILERMLVTLFVTIFSWLLFAYPIAYGEGNTIFGYWSWHYIQQVFGTGGAKEYLDILFQLSFCLYAVTMVIGSVINRIRIKTILWFIPVWVIGYYAPLAHMIWHEQGWLNQLGITDFSGALVVHLSAGATAYLLAYCLPTKSEQTQERLISNHLLWQLLATTLIVFGWFGFNMGPAEVWNQQAQLSLFNSFIGIAAGVLAFGIIGTLNGLQSQRVAMICDGMICGLVTSTAGAGVVPPYLQFVICFCACLLIQLFNYRILNKININDTVASFAMNGIGGLAATVGIGVFWSGTTLSVQCLGILTTLVGAIVITCPCLLLQRLQ